MLLSQHQLAYLLPLPMIELHNHPAYEGPEQGIMILDAGVDLDDELTEAEAAYFQRIGAMTLRGAVADLRPTIERASLTLGTLDMLGYGNDPQLPEIPVGMGLSNIEQRQGEPIPTPENCPYLADTRRLQMGDQVLLDILLDSDPKSITLIIQSGFATAAMFALLHGDLLKDRTKRIVVMGGVEQQAGHIILKNGFMQPDLANNNTFNKRASGFFSKWCQEEGVPMTITTRFGVYDAAVSFSIFDDLVATGNPMGPSLRERQRLAAQLLWQRANAAPGSKERGPLPDDRNREWCVRRICGNSDPGILATDDILPFLVNTNLYDPFNLLAAVPAFKEQLFHAQPVEVNGVTHEVIGIDGGKNVRDQQATQYVMHHSILEGCRHGTKILRAINHPLVATG